jgi:uncharacterized membrane protein required for colicin V production
LKEFIDHIPFIDLAIIGVLAFFIYLGWTHGMPRLAMVTGALYTGFLLASIYYHLFAVALARTFNFRLSFASDVIAFLVLDALVSVLMIGLLFSLFGHIEIGGKLAIFDKVGGTIGGFLSGLLIVGVLVALLRVPYEANKETLNVGSQMPVIQLFNDGYEKAFLAPVFIKTAPVLMSTVTPLLPREAKEAGAVPLLESIVSQR